MNHKKQIIEKIDDYLFDLMSNKERQLFEAEIEKSKELAKAVELQKIEHRTMELLAQEELQKNLNEWKKEKLEPLTSSRNEVKLSSIKNSSTIRKRIFQFSIAAIVLLLIGLFFGNQWVQQNYNSQVLAEYLFQTSVDRSRSEGVSSTNFPPVFQPVISAMIEKEYEKAIRLLNAINVSSYQEVSQLLQAECYFKLQDYNESISLCKNIIATAEDDNNREKAEWYLTLNYFVLEQKSEAKQLLEKITQNKNHAFFPHGKELENQLESFWGRLAN